MPRHNAAMLSPNSRCNDGPNSPHIHDRGCPKLWHDCMSFGLKRQGYRYAPHQWLRDAKYQERGQKGRQKKNCSQE